MTIDTAAPVRERPSRDDYDVNVIDPGDDHRKGEESLCTGECG